MELVGALLMWAGAWSIGEWAINRFDCWNKGHARFKEWPWCVACHKYIGYPSDPGQK